MVKKMRITKSNKRTHPTSPRENQLTQMAPKHLTFNTQSKFHRP